MATEKSCTTIPLAQLKKISVAIAKLKTIISKEQTHYICTILQEQKRLIFGLKRGG